MAETIASDFNLQKINTKEFAENIKATIDFGGNLFAVAHRGCGKTMIASNTIKQANHKEVYFNLSLFERCDLGGFPNFFGGKTDKYINFLMPAIYKDLIEGDQPCVAVLDEVDKADSSLLAPLLEFVQFHSINGQKLKNLRAIILTANLLSEGGSQPPPTLLDRVEKFLIEINPQHWLEWGGTAEGHIHPSISAYISDNPTDLVGALDQGENYSDKSPRGWDNASQLITYGEKHKWHHKMMMHKVAACVGKRAGMKYSAFFEHYQVLLPVVEDILNGKKLYGFSKLEPTKQLVVCMVLCQRYARMLDEVKDKSPAGSEIVVPGKVSEIGTRVAKFLQDSIDPEMALISIRGQLGYLRATEFNLLDDPSWDSIVGLLVNKMGV